MSWSSFSFSEMGASFQNYLYRPSLTDEIVKNSEASIECNSLKKLSKEDIKLYGIKAFDCYMAVWDFEDFWKRANTCDACVAFMDSCLTENPHDLQVKERLKSLEGILEKNLKYYKATNFEEMWVDDFGWWGLLGINAYLFLMKIGNYNLAQDYLRLSKECLAFMIHGGCDANREVQPVKYGCRNTSVKEPDKGVKNTVVNALLLLLSTKLYRLHAKEKFNDYQGFLNIACSQWMWFSKWFELKEYHYFKHFKNDEGAGLILERPIAIFNGSSYQDMSHPDAVSTWVWSGDNGLVIGALLDLIPEADVLANHALKMYPGQDINPLNFKEKLTDMTKKLIHGIQKGMIGKDGVFHEPPCLSSYAANGKDYLGGRGILVRYMDIQGIKAFSGIDFSENVLKTVEAIWQTRDEASNQFKAEFTSLENNLEYAKHFDDLWEFSDQGTVWNVETDLKTKNGICQAVGLDFIAAAMKI